MSQITFEYAALTRSGTKCKGVAEAPTRAQAYRTLVAKGLSPVWIRPRGAGHRARGGSRIKARDLASFTHQVSALLSARVPLTDVLSGIAEQEREGPVRRFALDLVRRVQSGATLASAMSAHRTAVGDVYVETVTAAESTGNLISALEQTADSIERSDEMTRAVRGALMYPACVLVVLAMATMFLITFIVPRFSTMFAGRGVELPMITRALGALGQSVHAHWWLYLGGAIAGGMVVRWSGSRPWGRAAFESLLHRVAPVRALLVGLAVSRFSRVLGMTLSSGLPLVESLELSGRASGRAGMIADANRLAAQVRAGGLLADALRGCRYLTPMARRLISSGEKAGEMPRMCSVVARYYDRQVLSLSKVLSTVIEPVLIVLIAGVVLLIALAIFLPMWDMVKVVG